MEIKKSKVVVDLGDGRTLELTIQQAGELRDLLCTNFPKYSGYYYAYPYTPTIWTSGYAASSMTTADTNTPPCNMQISTES